MRPLAALALVTLSLLAAAVPAAAVDRPSERATARSYTALADRAARAWIPFQYEKGAFVDPYRRVRSRGYGVAMIGYALLRAGLRADRERTMQAGARALRDELRTPAKAGVFDQWIAALTYNFARRRMARESAWRGIRSRMRAYLRALGAPRLGPGSGACFLSPTCYSNHKIVQAEARLELAGSGLRPDAGALRGDALRLMGPFAADAMGRSGRASGPGPRRGLGVLSDTGVWPLGYHALSAMMVARAAWRERGDLPRRLRANLRQALDTLVAYAAPDGDVAYIGTRHEQAWIPAATAYAAEVGARLLARDRERSGRYAALADRSLARLSRVYRRSPTGVLAPIPRLRRSGTYGDEGDVDAEATNGIALAALNLAGDVAARPRPVPASGLPADGPSWYVEPGEASFAATRRGDVWFAVRRAPRVLPGGRVPDLRFDFGVVALEQRTARGTWRRILAPRPRRALELASAGPRLVTAQGVGVPTGTAISARVGEITVRGGFRTTGGAWLRQGVRFRFQATRRGVRLRLRARAGDRLQFTAFLRGRVREVRGGVRDAVAATTFRPRAQIAVGPGGLTNCCDGKLVSVTATVVAKRDGVVTATVASRVRERMPVRPRGAARRARAGAGALLRM